MNVFLRIGTSVVFLALASYTVGVISEQRSRKAGNRVLLFLTIGILFDIIATSFMIMGSTKGIFSLHGFIGYSSLAGMLLDTILIWRFRMQNGAETMLHNGLHLYSRYAYIWWIIAFISGGLLVAMSH